MLKSVRFLYQNDQINVYLNNTEIPVVDRIKYLGMIITTDDDDENQKILEQYASVSRDVA